MSTGIIEVFRILSTAGVIVTEPSKLPEPIRAVVRVQGRVQNREARSFRAVAKDWPSEFDLIEVEKGLYVPNPRNNVNNNDRIIDHE